MIYLIGGAPRVGKTRLVTHVLRRQPMHAISTDAIRYMLRQSFAEYIPSALRLPEHEDILRETPQQILERQNAESKALWPMLVHMMQSYNQDGVDLLIEGVAVLPALVAALPFPHACVVLGNTQIGHIETIAREVANNPHDWLHPHTSEQVQAYGRFFMSMSEYLQQEAQAVGVPYLETSDMHFERALAQAVNALIDGARYGQT